MINQKQKAIFQKRISANQQQNGKQRFHDYFKDYKNKYYNLSSQYTSQSAREKEPLDSVIDNPESQAAADDFDRSAITDRKQSHFKLAGTHAEYSPIPREYMAHGLSKSKTEQNLQMVNEFTQGSSQKLKGQQFVNKLKQSETSRLNSSDVYKQYSYLKKDVPHQRTQSKKKQRQFSYSNKINDSLAYGKNRSNNQLYRNVILKAEGSQSSLIHKLDQDNKINRQNLTNTYQNDTNMIVDAKFEYSSSQQNKQEESSQSNQFEREQISQTIQNTSLIYLKTEQIHRRINSQSSSQQQTLELFPQIESNRDEKIILRYKVMKQELLEYSNISLNDRLVFELKLLTKELRKEFMTFQSNLETQSQNFEEFLVQIILKDFRKIVDPNRVVKIHALKSTNNLVDQTGSMIRLSDIHDYQTIDQFLKDASFRENETIILSFIVFATTENMQSIQDPSNQIVNHANEAIKSSYYELQFQKQEENQQLLENEIKNLKEEQVQHKKQVNDLMLKLQDKQNEIELNQKHYVNQIEQLRTGFAQQLQEECNKIKQLVNKNASNIKFQERQHKVLSKQISKEFDSDEEAILNMEPVDQNLLQVPIPLQKSQSTKIKGVQKPRLVKQAAKQQDLSLLKQKHLSQTSRSSLGHDELDMVFMFADPLVVENIGMMAEYIIPLDLDNEYSNIVNNLHLTGKEFRLKKLAFSVDSLQDIIQKNPKILHISCHGSFKQTQTGKSFYVSIEDHNGVEKQLDQEQLKELLDFHKDNHSIKLAMVSACQSEEIGRIFFNSGIPLVIAVNSNEEIADQACQIFSKKFYDNLLMGKTIKQAFNMARNQVSCANVSDFDVCCCAHQHSDECLWYKFYQMYPKEAHDLHSHNCQCYQNKFEASRKKHSKNCESLKRWRNFMVELEQNPNIKPKSLLYDNHTSKDQMQIQKPKETTSKPQALSKLAALVDSDDEDFAFADDLSDEGEFLAKKIGNEEDDLIMCCCKKHEPHDEGMKFVTHIRNDKDWNTQLFPMRNKGLLINEEKENASINFPFQVDKRKILGRQTSVHQILKFLNAHISQDQKRILVINGSKSECASDLALFAIKYAIDRGQFENGAFYIDNENKQSEQGLIRSIFRKIGFFGSCDLQQAVLLLKNQRMLIMIDNCDKLIERNPQKLVQLLNQFIENTQMLKIILISNKMQIDNLIEKSETDSIEQITLTPLSRQNAVRMMFLLCKHLPHFQQQFETDQALNEHKLFDLHQQYSPMQVQKMSALIKNKVTLDEIYINEEKIKTENATLQTTKLFENDMDCQLYAKIKQGHPNEMKLINIIGLATSGLFTTDIEQIIALKKLSNHKSMINFGDWQHFLDCQFGSKNIYCESQNQHIDQITNKQMKNDVPEFKILESNENETINITKLQLNKSIASTFKELAQQESEFLDTAIQYLQYMSLLSRLLLQKINEQKMMEFDPYVLSNNIEEGIWCQKDEFKFLMYKLQTEQSLEYQQQIDKNAVHLFEEHESNFLELIENADDLFGSNLNDLNICENYSELCLNITSIFLMLNRISDLNDCWHYIESICENHQKYKRTLAKVKMMQASIMIQSINDNIAKNKFSEIQLELNQAEDLIHELEKSSSFAQFEIDFLQALIQIKQWKQPQKNPNQRRSHFNKSKQLTIEPTDNEDVLRSKSKSDVFVNMLSPENQDLLLTKGMELLQKCMNQDIIIDNLKTHAKVVLVYSQIIQDLYRNYQIEELESIKQILSFEDLDIKLEQVVEDLHELYCYNLSNECLFYHASLLSLMANSDDMLIDDEVKAKYFKRCRQKLTRCVENSRFNGQQKIFLQAKKMFQEVSFEIKSLNYNKFFFAKSSFIDFNIDDQANNLQVWHKNVQDYYSGLINQLRDSRKQVEVNIEVLSYKFIDFIKQNDCKILHLTNCMFSSHEEFQDTIIVEKSDFTHEKLSANQFKELLKPTIGDLNITLVLIDKIGGESFAKVLLELGVKHVISFKFRNESTSKISTISKGLFNQQNMKQMVDRETKFRNANTFCFYFSQKFYANLINNFKIKDAISDAEQFATHHMNKEMINIEVEVMHLTNIKQNLKIFDSLSIGENRGIEDGEVCFMDEQRAMSNIEFELLKMPFIFKANGLFNQVVELIQQHVNERLIYQRDIHTTHQKITNLNDDKQIEANVQKPQLKINIYGDQGTGKTRLAQEVARYFRFRYAFQSGIFYINCCQDDQMEKVRDMIFGKQIFLQNIDQQQEQKQNIHRNKKEESFMIIMDNCDAQNSIQKSKFQINLTYFEQNLSNLTLLCISRQKMSQKYNFNNYLRNQPFDYLQSLIYIGNLKLQSKFIHFENMIEITKQAKGNASMLNIFSLLVNWAQGKQKILKKIEILPIKNLFEVYEKDIQSTFGGQEFSSYGFSIMSARNERKSLAYRRSKTQEEFIHLLKLNLHKQISDLIDKKNENIKIQSEQIDQSRILYNKNIDHASQKRQSIAKYSPTNRQSLKSSNFNQSKSKLDSSQISRQKSSLKGSRKSQFSKEKNTQKLEEEYIEAKSRSYHDSKSMVQDDTQSLISKSKQSELRRKTDMGLQKKESLVDFHKELMQMYEVQDDKQVQSQEGTFSDSSDYTLGSKDSEEDSPQNQQTSQKVIQDRIVIPSEVKKQRRQTHQATQIMNYIGRLQQIQPSKSPVPISNDQESQNAGQYVRRNTVKSVKFNLDESSSSSSETSKRSDDTSQLQTKHNMDNFFNIDGFIVEAYDLNDKNLSIEFKNSHKQEPTKYNQLVFFKEEEDHLDGASTLYDQNQAPLNLRRISSRRPTVASHAADTKSITGKEANIQSLQKVFKQVKADSMDIIKKINIFVPNDFYSQKSIDEWNRIIDENKQFATEDQTVIFEESDDDDSEQIESQMAFNTSIRQ